MPTQATLISVILFYSIHLIRLYPKYIINENYHKFLVIMLLGLLIGIFYHYTGKLLIIDMLVVLILIYFHYLEFPSIKPYIILIFIFTICARFVHYVIKDKYLESFFTIMNHFMGHLICIHIYNLLD